MHDLILKMLCATRPLLPGRQWVSPRLLAETGRPQVPRRTSWASQRRWNATTCLAQPGDQDGYSAGGGVGPYGSVVSNGRLHQQGTSLGPEPVEGPALAADSFQWNKQWYPLVPVSYLDRDQPKGMVVLGKSLVVWYHSPSKSWQCFEDMCPHRLAPLSEGRIEPATGSLMCSYHGWEFGPGGACTSIPQADSPQQEEAALGSRRSCVASYPVREQEGMLWVWLDASPSAALESSMRRVALSSELQDGSGILLGDWYMRDLPVSYEYLLENLVDPGHVNFAHHNRIGSRDRAGPIALIQSGPVTAQEGFAVGMDRKDLPGGAPSVTRFVPPSLAWLSFNPLGSGPAFSFLFYAVPIAPCHSRIFAGYSTNAAPAIVRQALKSGPLTPLLHSFQWLSDLGAHEIIDGDTLFLRHQEGRTAGSGRRWGSAQYFMPSSSDRGVVLLRKWLEECAGGGPAYGPAAAGFQAMAPLTREQVLDRFEQHTKTCPHCSRALTGVRALRSGVSLATTSAFVAAFTLAMLQALSPPPLLRLPPPFGGPLPPRASAPFLLLAGALAGAALNQALAQLEARFVYTDYTHHDK